MTLTLEVNAKHTDKTPTFTAPNDSGIAMLTPPVGEDYWLYRVKLGDQGQAMLGFGKFGLVGIGFAHEEDWNSNLPSSSDTDRIWQHIKHNKGDESIPDEDCIEAIRLIQLAAAEYLASR